MDKRFLLTDTNGRDTAKAVKDLEAAKLPALFSYRQAYFVGAKAQWQIIEEAGYGISDYGIENQSPTTMDSDRGINDGTKG